MKSGIVVLLLLVFVSAPALAAQRVALVIGNSRYASAPLKNPVNDASDMAAKLRELGFQVILLTNAGQRDMERGIRDFGNRLQSADIRLFYYAGHGMQIQGANYLVPVDSEVYAEDDVKYESVDAGRVLDTMRRSTGGVNVMILDACRNNPFARSFRSAARGLKRMDAPIGTLLVYATSPESVAADGQGRNGIFTKYLLRHLGTRGMALDDIMRRVRKDVVSETGQRQIPWTSSSLVDEVFLTQGTMVADGSPRPPASADGRASVKIESQPSGATVYVNNAQRGRTPINVIGLNPGRIRVRLEMSGYAPVEQTLSVSAGETLYLPLTLSAVRRTRLTVRPEPSDATVRILNIQARYRSGIELSPGRYQVEVSRQGYATFQRWITLESGQSLVMPVSLQARRVNAPTPAPAPAASASPWRGSLPDLVVMKVPGGQKQTKPSVRFPHAKHARENADCFGCHHKENDRSAIRSCSAKGCHWPMYSSGKMEKRSPNSYYQAFHNKGPKACIGCHKAKGRGPKSCRECHPK